MTQQECDELYTRLRNFDNLKSRVEALTESIQTLENSKNPETPPPKFWEFQVDYRKVWIPYGVPDLIDPIIKAAIVERDRLQAELEAL